MSYTINHFNGTTLIPGGLSDGTIDNTHTSLTLVGRDYAGYGAFLNENFVYLLENFASGSSPANPLAGQLWWDTTNNILRVWSGNSWKISTGATSTPYASPPTDLSALGGDLWFDNTNQQLKVYSGSNWITVGPASTPATGNTGALPALITDTSSGVHVVLEFIISGTIYAILSKDTFSSNLTGFATVKAGLNFSTTASPSLVLSTQDQYATPNTLVQRDSSGGITGQNITGATITASTVTATTLNSTTFNGNLVATTANATTGTFSTISVQGINATTGYTGTMLTPSQTNITSVGILQNLTASGTTNLNGIAYLNGVALATLGGSATFSSINGTPIGNVTPSIGAFTTISASTSLTTPISIVTGTEYVGTINATQINAPTIGNSGAVLYGTLNSSSATQNNITTATNLASIGTITTGTWHGTIISPTYGGTGINNGNNTLTLGASYTLNQSVASGSAPTFTGTNFSSIPNGALTNSAITVSAGAGLSGGGTVSLGSTVTLSLASGAAVNSLTAGTGVSVSASTGAVTVSIGQPIGTGNAPTFAGLTSNGTLTVNGAVTATGDIYAYYSDDNLKTKLGTIENALDKLCSLEGFYYQANATAQALGYPVRREVGLSAQKTQAIMPEIVGPAPIDNQYLTIQYEKFAPLIVEAIKELRAELNELKVKFK